LSTHLSATAQDVENDVEVAAKIRSQAQLGELTSQVRVVEGYYNLDTGKVEWTAKQGEFDARFLVRPKSSRLGARRAAHWDK
jgi:hypothetical protein